MPSNRDIARMLSFSEKVGAMGVSWDTKFVRDQGWKVAEEAFKELDKRGLGLKIGVQSDEESYPNGETVAKIAAWNHFGTEDIPARPYLTKAMDENTRRLESFSAKIFKRIMDGENIEKSLGLLGEEVVSVIRRMITTLNQPPNAPSTIKKKGSSNPLIDTGRLRASQRWAIINKLGTTIMSSPKSNR